MKKIVLLFFVILMIAIGVTVQAEIKSGNDIKNESCASVSKSARAGGFPEITTDPNIADCGISPVFKEPVVDEPAVAATAAVSAPAPAEKPKKYVSPAPAPVPSVSPSPVQAPAQAPAQAPVAMKKKIIISLNVEFNPKKAIVQERYYDDIKRVADFMKENPDSVCEIQGHTDNVGDKTSNKVLSQKRAESVRQYIIDKFGIDGKRITAVGFGGEIPIASNFTAEGRQKNRRVEAVIVVIK